MTHRSFTVPPFTPRDPITFDLSGSVDVDGEQGFTWREEFRCVEEAPSALVSDVLLAGSVSPDGTVKHAVGVLVRFLETVIVDDDREKFRLLIRDPKRHVQASLLGEVVSWLIEVYTGRPTTPPTSSADGRSHEQDSSPVESLSDEALPQPVETV